MTTQTSTRRVISLVLIAALSVIGVVASTSPEPASATPSKSFDPGNIISDAVFFDGTAMTATEVQSFLNSKVSSCQSGYVCLKDYRQNTPSVAGDTYCSAYIGGANESAASIIAKVGAACNISPEVLLITLQKEQGLVTHTWPSTWRFDKAMGMACSDSSPCDPAYSGFFYQIYFAARQFQRYAASPTRYNYQAGRVNNILFHPNTACGTSPVYIQNQATAGLYNYTPYQPNSAALANLYGTGDSCSSYGNRNFWRYYWDWFGNPILSSPLLKAAGDSKIYIIGTDNKKYWIDNWALYTEMSVLGKYAEVSSAYLSTFEDAGTMQRLVTNPSGRIALLDSGVLHSFLTCADMKNFGYATCGGSFVVSLSDADFNAFTLSTSIKDTVDSPTGSRYSVTTGTYTEYLTTTTRTNAGFVNSPVVLNDARLSHMTAITPALPTMSLVKDSGTGVSYLVTGGTAYPVDDTSIVPTSVPSGTLNHSSFSFLSTSTTHTGLAMSDGAGGVLWLQKSGAISDTASRVTGSAGLAVLPPALASLWPITSTVTDGTLVKSPTANEVYYVTPGGFRHVLTWKLAQLLAGSSSPTLVSLPASVVAGHVNAGDFLMPGTLAKSADSPQQYFISGLDTRAYVPSFALTSAAGISGWTSYASGTLDNYSITSDFGFGFVCGSTTYIASGGVARALPAGLVDDFTLPTLSLDAAACTTLKVGAEATAYIVSPSGKVYRVEAGTKRHVTSWSVWVAIRGNSTYMPVTQQFVDALPDGSPIT